MQYIYQYDIVALFISLTVLINFLYKRTINTRVTRAFIICIISLIVSTTFDLISVYSIPNAAKIPLWLNYVINILYYVGLGSIPPIYFSCIIFSIEEKQPFSNLIKRILFFPYLIIILLVVSTPFTKWIFYFDNNFNYNHGSLNLVPHAISFAYSFFCIGITHTKRDLLSKLQKNTVNYYVLATIIATIIQLTFPKYLIIEFAFSITIFITYFCFDNPSSYKDPEMSVYNIKAFDLSVQSILKKKKRNRILGIQIIGTKYIENTIGSENTSLLLKTVANYLQMSAIHMPLYRLSKTRLAFILPDDENKMNQIISRINLAFSEPFRIGEFKLFLKVHFVKVLLPTEADNLEDTIDIIEKSLKEITKEPTGKIISANAKILNDKKRNQDILKILTKAVETEDFYIVYQPIWSTEEQKFSIIEALIRLNDDEIGYISPKEFIPIAEQNGLINKIGVIVMKKVCSFARQNKIWTKGVKYIQINLSVIQCMQIKLYKDLLKTIEEYDLDYEYFNFEIKEDSIFASRKTLLNNMKKLAEKKIYFSLDDFGTTFSNITSLIDFPFKTIKLDLKLVKKTADEDKIKKILNNIVNLAVSLGIEVIAEGIETIAEFEEIKKMGCQYVQGFYYSKPLNEVDLLEILR